MKKKVMVFGNWDVTESSIEWKGPELRRFSIPFGELNEIRSGADGEFVFYNWILEATNQEWLAQNDLFDLNYAFVFAFAKSGLDFNYEIFDNTLEAQYDQFDDEDNENFEL